MRRWLVGAGLVLTAVLVGVAGLATVNRMARQTVNEKHIYGFEGEALSIDLTVGEVAIVPGTLEDQILVSRTLTYGLRRPFVEERIDGDTFRVRDGDCGLPIGAICHVKWLLQVPPRLHLSITTKAGNINVSTKMTGAVKLVSDSGAVRARGLAGPSVQLLSRHGPVDGTGIRSTHVVATSDTGDISLSFRTPPKFVKAKTAAGFVEVVLPDGDEAYKVSAHAGEDQSKTVAVKHLDDSATRKVTAESDKGRVTVRDVSSGDDEEQADESPR